MRRMALSAALAAVVLVAAIPASAQEATSPLGGYRPPVDAPVADPFRPPAEPWAPGNRGIEYATAPGTPVLAAASGEVVFAGPVAGGLHVVVLHPDGVRTSYSFLQSIAVHRGDRVEQGRPVGTSGEHLHFGARLGDVYIDPAQLFQQGPPHVFLVPDEVRRPASEEEERGGLLDLLKGLGNDLLNAGVDGLARAGDLSAAGLTWARDNGAAGLEWAGEMAVAGGGLAVGELKAEWDRRLRELRAALHYAQATNPMTPVRRLIDTLPEWWDQRHDCTPSSVQTPTPGNGHVAVLVSGFGSSSTDGAGVDTINTLALGYHPADVVRFSYRGGTSAESRFSPADTTVDIRKSARRLSELLERVAAENPGMPIDILAHSQGGLVARSTLAYEFDRSPSRSPVSALVTVATPHQGTDFATFGTMFQDTLGGQAVATAVDVGWHHGMGGPSVKGTSVHQMAEVSAFIRGLNQRPLPAGVRVTSIGAQADYVVTAGRTRLPGAHHAVVSHLSPSPHNTLPGSGEALREIALGLDGRPPTCQSLHDMLMDTAVSETIGTAEDSIAAGLWLWSARRTGPSPVIPDDPGGEE